ncbi:sulfotransferase family 2 domain-containing protein [Nocardioides houyundeii]|uniref:sulfotransferase family 2 domain-containing protein n=1 Tax=Nocardioides houyundeii TaxID=2045452 RepID=UPI0013B38542|nr:sulfotransferase family 2 domain-containing protein [Nocardioides houyundeii]
MLVSDAHRFLFVHVQKTGGVSVEHLLRSHLPEVRGIDGLTRHARLGQILAAEPDLVDYWTVGFVRNPWARLVSWYGMVQRFRRLAEQGRPKAQRFLAGEGFMARVARDYADFDAFVLRGPDDWPRLRTPQVAYLTAEGRTADFVGRTESFDADVRTVMVRLGLSDQAPIPRDNAAPPRDYRRDYSPLTRDRVAEVFAADLRAFDYTF